MLDLAKLSTAAAAETGTVVEIIHPIHQTPLGIRITVYGADSKEYRQALRDQTNERLKRANKARGGKAKVTAEQLEAESLDLLVICTKKWESKDEAGNWVPTIRLNGVDMECTPENVRKLYSDPGYTWLKNQVDEEIGDLNNFLTN